MTLGFIFSFIVMVFGIGIYLLVGIARLLLGAATSDGRRQELENERILRERLRVDNGEYFKRRFELSDAVKAARAAKKDPAERILQIMPDDIRKVFGENYEKDFKEYFRAHENFSPFDKMVKKLTMLQMARLGQGEIFQYLDFDESNFERSLKYCQAIEENWRTAGIDIHFELRKTTGKKPEYYMFPTEACYHFISTPDFRW